MWMDNYCKTNPLEKASGGALKLYIELLQRRTTGRGDCETWL